MRAVRSVLVGAQCFDDALAGIGRQLAVLIDDVAETEQLTGVTKRLRPAAPNQRNDEVDAVAADVDGATNRNGRLVAGTGSLDGGNAQGSTVSQRPFQAGALPCRKSVNLALSCV
jgi:hypothetical protein